MERERAAIYLRHSPKPNEKRTLDSIDNQRAACERYAKFANLDIVSEIVQEFKSAKKVPFFQRGGDEVIKLANNAGIRHLICQRVDRIFRDTVDGLTSMKRLQKAKVALHFADEGGSALNCNNATGVMLFTVRLSFASFEPDLISERTSDAHRRIINEMMSANGNAPYGFAIDGKVVIGGGSRSDRNRYKLKFNKQECRNLQLIHKWVVVDKLSYQEIADLLNGLAKKDPSYFTRSGEAWDRIRVFKIIRGARNRLNWEAVLTLDCECPEDYDRLATLRPPNLELSGERIPVDNDELYELPDDGAEVEEEEGEVEDDGYDDFAGLDGL